MRRVNVGMFVVGLLLAVGCVTVAFVGTARAADDVPRMKAEELLPLLDSPDVEIIDVRREWDWNKSEGMIKNGVRRAFDRAGQWMAELDKSKTIVLYCA